MSDFGLVGSARRADPTTQRGFTLVELMIVVAIIATLAAIAFPPIFNHVERMRIIDAMVDMREIELDIDQFGMDFGILPASLDQVGEGSRLDPWGHPYQYLNIIDGGPGVNGKSRKDHSMVPVNSDYDLYSMGPDGKSRPPFTAKDSKDDIVRASDGSFIGTVHEFEGGED